MRVLRVLIVLVQMGLIITGLVLAVGVFFYTVAWVALVVTSFSRRLGSDIATEDGMS